MPKPAVDLSEFFRLSRPKKKPCSVAFAREQLTAAEQAQLDAALAQDTGIITAAAVQQWLAKRGHTTSTSAVSNHRRGVCTCADRT